MRHRKKKKKKKTSAHISWGFMVSWILAKGVQKGEGEKFENRRFTMYQLQ